MLIFQQFNFKCHSLVSRQQRTDINNFDIPIHGLFQKGSVNVWEPVEHDDTYLCNRVEHEGSKATDHKTVDYNDESAGGCLHPI